MGQTKYSKSLFLKDDINQLMRLNLKAYFLLLHGVELNQQLRISSHALGWWQIHQRLPQLLDVEAYQKNFRSVFRQDLLETLGRHKVDKYIQI